MTADPPLKQAGRSSRPPTHLETQGGWRLSGGGVGQRGVRLGLALALLFSVVACEAQAPPIEFSYGSDAQTFAVYAVVLRDVLGSPPGLAVLDPQTTFSYDQDMWARCYEVVRAESHVSPALWRALPHVNLTPALLEAQAAAGLSPDLVVATVEQRGTLDGAGYLGENTFSKAYPGRSLIQVSRVAFSPDEQVALLYVWRTDGPLAGDGAVYALAREGGEWAITFRAALGAS
jgi:hypothetical protein